MLKLAKLSTLTATLFLSITTFAFAQDLKAGEKVFKKCKACHAVGEGAKNKVGPHLNDLFGRAAGSLDGYKYSKAIKAAGADGLIWVDGSITEFVTKPKKLIKKTKMSFAGLKKEKDRENLIAYLKSFSASEGTTVEETPKPEEKQESKVEAKASTKVTLAAPSAKDTVIPTHGILHLGRVALKEEISAWDIDIRPDGQGLPEGSGTVAQGEPIYIENCAVCHGDFGEGVDRWPVLAGGFDTLEDERPEKTIGSYWPYLSTVYDYVRRAMPFGNARSLSDDDVYALTAYLMYLNDIVTEEDFKLSKENFLDIPLPNEANFFEDDRQKEKHYAVKSEPCMTNCISGAAKVSQRARVLDVTPDVEDD